jgi:ribosomal protein L11 methyltransferase
MEFKQLVLEIPKEEADSCSDLLTELGAVAVTLEDAKDDPLFEPAIGTTPLWQNTKLIALFENEIDLEPIQETLKENLDPNIFASLQIELVPDKDWIRASLDQFKPQLFGTSLWICPSWCEVDLDNETDPIEVEPIIVRLDPGLAFGTGSHPTTQLCLQWLATHNIKNKLVLDYGCGSGILGIAALKLGAKQLLAVDHDPQALLSTTENVKLNGLSATKISCYMPEELQIPQKIDLILANILANPLIELAPKLAAMLAPKGQIVLSGILVSQVDQVIEAYQAFMQDFIIEQSQEWISIQASLKP